MQVIKEGLGDFPRRNRVDLLTQPEKAIYEAKVALEAYPAAHPLLTEAGVLLQQAADKVADYIEMPTKPGAE